MGTLQTTPHTTSPREREGNGPLSRPPPLKTCGEQRTLRLNPNRDHRQELPAEQDSRGLQNRQNLNQSRKKKRNLKKRRRRPHHHLQNLHPLPNLNLKRRKSRRRRTNRKKKNLTKNEHEWILTTKTCLLYCLGTLFCG